jgi:predicted Zn-dependent protease
MPSWSRAAHILTCWTTQRSPESGRSTASNGNSSPVQREQFKRWQFEVSTPDQRDMLAHLTARADQLSALQDQILALVDELYQGSINRLMGVNDANLAAAVLSSRLSLPKR